MKQVYKIDSSGFYVEPVILKNGEKTPSDCVEVMPASLYKAKWMNGVWSEGATQEEINEIVNTPQPVSEIEQIKKNQELMQQALDELLLGGGL
jgi:hypothetical protein